MWLFSYPFFSDDKDESEAEKLFSVYEQCLENAEIFANQKIQTQDLIDAQMEVEIRNDIQVISSEKSNDEVGDNENKDEEDNDKISTYPTTEEEDANISLSSLSSEMGSVIKEEDDSGSDDK